MLHHYLYIAATTAILFFLDHFTKQLAETHLAHEPLPLTSWFSLTYSQNTGIAFSIPIPQSLLIPFTIVFIIAIIIYALRFIDLSRHTTKIILALILSGALGNLYDRITLGYVIDFIKIGWWPIFNLADTFLTIAAFLIIIIYGTIIRKDLPKSP